MYLNYKERRNRYEVCKSIGRTPGSGVQPRACMCTDGYAGYRGNDDGCVHCGCGCGGEGEYRTGNRVNAVATFRSSTL